MIGGIPTLDIILAYHGYSRCFIKSTPCTIVGDLQHETASNNPNLCRYVDAPELLGRNRFLNHWNRAILNKQVHAFTGLDINGEMKCAFTLPPDISCWGVGGSYNGSNNYDRTRKFKFQRAYWQMEACRGGTNPKKQVDVDYYWKLISYCERVHAWRCRENGWNPDDIVTLVPHMTGHRESARVGLGSNHADPDSYMKVFGDSMDKFRERIKARMEEPPEEVHFIYAYSMPTFYWRPKSRYAGVVLLQQSLNKLGYAVATDGHFGAETHDAVKAFRVSHGIPTPVNRKGEEQAVSCDKQTWAAINKALNAL